MFHFHCLHISFTFLSQLFSLHAEMIAVAAFVTVDKKLKTAQEFWLNEKL